MGERARLCTFKTKMTLAVLGTTPSLGTAYRAESRPGLSGGVSGGPARTPSQHNRVSSHMGPVVLSPWWAVRIRDQCGNTSSAGAPGTCWRCKQPREGAVWEEIPGKLQDRN